MRDDGTRILRQVCVEAGMCGGYVWTMCEPEKGPMGLFHGRRRCTMQGWPVVSALCSDCRKVLGVKPTYTHQVYGINQSVFVSKPICRVQTYTCNI